MSYKINIISNEGHTELEFETASEAVEEVKNIAKNDKKWVYLGTNQVPAEDLTPGMIEENDELFLTNPLVGG